MFTASVKVGVGVPMQNAATRQLLSNSGTGHTQSPVEASGGVSWGPTSNNDLDVYAAEFCRGAIPFGT